MREDRASERRGCAGRRGSLPEAIDVIHHHSVAGVAARLGKRTIGEGILVQEAPQRVVQARPRELRPRFGSVLPADTQILEQILETRRNATATDVLVNRFQPADAWDRCYARRNIACAE